MRIESFTASALHGVRLLVQTYVLFVVVVWTDKARAKRTEWTRKEKRKKNESKYMSNARTIVDFVFFFFGFFISVWHWILGVSASVVGGSVWATIHKSVNDIAQLNFCYTIRYETGLDPRC